MNITKTMKGGGVIEFKRLRNEISEHDARKIQYVVIEPSHKNGEYNLVVTRGWVFADQAEDEQAYHFSNGGVVALTLQNLIAAEALALIMVQQDWA